jgi:hypothetical protein
MPIPGPEAGDVEDVSWALSTAQASWQNGDASEALKWLRRAAEAATEATANERALLLAKAAADLASRLERTSLSPPTHPTHVPPDPPASPSVAVTARSGPPPSGPTSNRPPASGRAPLPPVSGLRQSAPPPRPGPLAPRTPILTDALHPSRMPAMSGPSPVSTLASVGNEGRKPRRSSHNLERETKGTKSPETKTSSARGSKPAAGEVRRRRSSRPPPTEVTENPIETAPRPPRPPSVSDAIDAWPTQAMEGSELTHLTHEMTRTPPDGIPPPPASGRSLSVSRGPPPLPSSATAALQAVRVVVWQAPEGGVRIAPAGTHVTAPTVEAVIVALDPKTDLAGWLSRR